MVTLPLRNHDTPVDLLPRTIIGIGLNYREHVAESHSLHGRDEAPDAPAEPVLFAKTPNVLIGPDAPIVLPRYLRDCGFDELRTDYEAELAVIIARECRSVAAETALEYVLGYTCMNDVSQRNFQRGDVSGWFRGKSLDTFGPIGPVIVPPQDIADPQSLDIQCRLNGEVVQQSNTRLMIFPVRELIAYISKHITLQRGDIITTGTPAGVGPLSHGDVVEVEIERIGTLRNPVVDAAVSSAHP